MLKKTIAVLLTLAMVFTFVSCNKSNSNQSSSTTSTANTSATATEVSGKLNTTGDLIRIGAMPKAASLYTYVAEELGLFEEAGLKVEIVTFATGAPINEAMAAGRIDIATSGMATVYALATGMYTYVGDGTITTEGQVIYARTNSDVVKAGKNAKGIYGSADSVKKKSILGPLSTTAHYLAITYAEQFGLSSSDFEMVSMDFPQAYEAFITGNGDMISTTPPYSTQLGEDPAYTQVADLYDVMGAPLVDAIYVQNNFIKNRTDDVIAVLECLYEAQNRIARDPELRKELGMKIYAEEGITYSESDMESEINFQTYFTWDMLENSKFEFGATMTNIGAFFVDQGMIAEDDYPNIQNSIDRSYLERAIAYHESKTN